MPKSYKRLSHKTNQVFKVISSKWPTNPLEVATAMEDNGDVKSLSAKYIYHFKKLDKTGLIRMKKVGNTYVVWPMEIERLRFIHELTKGGLE